MDIARQNQLFNKRIGGRLIPDGDIAQLDSVLLVCALNTWFDVLKVDSINSPFKN